MKLKIMIAVILSVFLATSAFAGTEDWQGSYSIELPDGNTTTIIHTPTFVQFTFMRAGKCINLSKGSNMNGLILKQDVELCVASNIDEFTNEAEKVGTIIDKNIIPGSTYTY